MSETITTHWSKYLNLRERHFEVLRALDSLDNDYRKVLGDKDFDPKERTHSDRDGYAVGMDYGAYTLHYWMNRYLEKRRESLERQMKELAPKVQDELGAEAKRTQEFMDFLRGLEGVDVVELSDTEE